MLANEWCAAPNPGDCGTVAALDEGAGVIYRRSQFRVLQRSEIPAGFQLGVLSQVRGRRHREEEDTAGHALAGQLLAGVPQEELGHRSNHGVHNLRSDAAVAHGLPFEGLQFSNVNAILFHPLEEGSGAGGHSAALEHIVDVTIGAGPVDAHPVLPGGLTVDAHALEDRAFDVPYLRRVGQGASHGLLAGDVDVLPLSGQRAMGVGEHGASCRSGRAVQVEVREAGPERSAIRVAREVHESAHGHASNVSRLVVGVGAVLSESGDGRHDHARLDFREPRVAKTQAVEIAWVAGLNDEIGGCDQSLQQGAAIGVFQVKSDTPLVGAVGPPVQALTGSRIIAVERPQLARRTAAGGLHLQYIGTQVGQDFAAQETALVGQVEHTVGGEEHFA